MDPKVNRKTADRCGGKPTTTGVLRLAPTQMMDRLNASMTPHEHRQEPSSPHFPDNPNCITGGVIQRKPPVMTRFVNHW